MGGEGWGEGGKIKKEINLQGLRILNTRPEAQAHELNQAIIDAGGEAIAFPTIAIEPIPTASWLTDLPSLDTVSQVIFTSSNAVHCFFAGLTKQRPWPEKIRVVAIGHATAQALEQHHIPVHFIPHHANSESLLELDSLQELNQEALFLIKGEGGRTLIPEVLATRGAIVSVINVYRRILPQFNPIELTQLWQNDAIDMIVFTSQEAMQNCFDLFGEQARAWLQKKPCVVISPRLAEAARLLGMKNIITATPETILTTIASQSRTKPL